MVKKDKASKVNHSVIGYKMLSNVIKMEGSLAELLRVETRLLKIKMKKADYNEVDLKVNKNHLKYILYLLTILDHRIEAAMKLIGK